MKNYFIKLYLLFFLSRICIFSQLDESTPLYDDSDVAEIRVYINQEYLDYMETYPLRDSLFTCNISFKNKYIDETVENIGISIRGNTSRTSAKKSFKLKFDAFEKDKTFHTLKEMNINGEHTDPTTIRSKLCWDLYKDMGMVSTKAAHTTLFFNDVYQGLYIYVENIDQIFLTKNYKNSSGNLWKCLFPASLAYLGEDQELYKFTHFDSIKTYRVYDLKTNNSHDDYSRIKYLTSVINNVPDSLFSDSLLQIIDINSLLKYFSLDVAIGSWDDYWNGWNNYYLYDNPESGKFEIIPYDYDNTFGIDYYEIDWALRDIYNWGNGDGDSPLATRIMNTPELRNLYTHFLEHYKKNVFELSNWETRADSIKEKITNFAETDPFRNIKGSFTSAEFHQSYDSAGYKSSVDYILISRSLKEFVNVRNESISEQLNYVDALPSIYSFKVSKNNLADNDTLKINASVFSKNNINEVSVAFQFKDGSSELIPLSFNPNYTSKNIADWDNWSLEYLPNSFWEEANIKIKVQDEFGNINYFPKSGMQITRIVNKKFDLILNEIMSNNNSILSDLGTYTDWIEIYNNEDFEVDLSGKYLTDKKDKLTKWKIPESIFIPAKGYLLFWCDEETLNNNLHTNFKISSNGEFIAIAENDGTTILDSITIPALGENNSYSKFDNDIWEITNNPTPGAPNIITDINEIKFRFENNLSAFPNPFNPKTNIEFSTNVITDINLRIFNIMGETVWTTKIEKASLGKHLIEWDSLNNFGNKLPSGIYFLQAIGSNFNIIIKLVLLK